MDDETTLSEAADDLAEAAESVSDAADAVAETPADAVDTTPIAEAVDDAAEQVITLDHAERLARLEARLEGTEFARTEHFHSDYAYAGHEHTPPEPVTDIPLPSEPVVETSDDESESEPTDEPPKRRHFLTRRIGDIFGG